MASEWTTVSYRKEPKNFVEFYNLFTKATFHLPRFADIAIKILESTDLPEIDFSRFRNYKDFPHMKEILQDIYQIKIYIVKDFLFHVLKFGSKPKGYCLTSQEYFLDNETSFNNLMHEFKKYENSALRYFKMPEVFTKNIDAIDEKTKEFHEKEFHLTLETIKYLPGFGIEYQKALESFESKK